MKILKILIPTITALAIAYPALSAPVGNVFNNVIPSANQTYDLGTTTPAREWKNVYTQNLTVSGTCSGCAGFSFPYTVTSNFNNTANSTTTQIWFRGSPYSLTASSTSVLTYASTTALSSETASTTNLNLTGVLNSILKTGTDGAVGAVTISSPLTYSGGTLSLGNYDWTFGKTFNNLSLTPTTTYPLWIKGAFYASSTANFDNYVDFLGIANPSAPPSGYARFHALTTQGFTRFEQDNEAATNITLGQDNVILAKNTSGSAITKGQVVYASGSTGNVPNIALAKADSNTTLPPIGVALDTINNNNFGQVMKLGILDSVNTSAFTSGDSLWVSTTTAGALVNYRPLHPFIAARVATVLVSGVGNGSLLVITAPFMGQMDTGTNQSSFKVGTLTGGGTSTINSNGVASILPFASTTAVTSTTASTTNLVISGITGTQCLRVTTDGTVSGTGSACAGGGVYEFTPLLNFATTASATSSPIWGLVGIFASSTSRFEWASTTGLTTSGSAFLANTDGNVAIGATSTPGSLFSIQGIGNFTTATSSMYGTGGIDLDGGCFAINGTCVGGGNPGGVDTNVQFNDGGAFGGDAGFTYNKTADRATLSYASTTVITATTASTTNLVISGVTGTQCLHVTTDGTVSGTGSDCGAGGGTFSFTPRTNYATTTNATSTPIWGLVGLYASSTSKFEWASTTGLSVSGFANFDDGATTSKLSVNTQFWAGGTGSTTITSKGWIGVGTTSPYAALSVEGLGVFNNLHATDTAATSTFSGGSVFGTTTDMVYEYGSGNTYVSSLVTGTMSFDNDPGTVTWVNLPLSSTTIANRTKQSYTAEINGFPALTVYGESDGYGSASTTRVGIGTTTPYAQLTVWSGSIGGNTALNNFEAVDTASTSLFVIQNAGNVGVASSTPWRKFSVTGTVGFDGLTNAVGDAVCISANKEITYNSGQTSCAASSKRFKYDIKPLVGSWLNKLMRFNPVSFKNKHDNKENVGLIAEDVEKIDKRLVNYDKDGLVSGVKYENLTAVLLKIAQEQQQKIDLLENRIKKIENGYNHSDK